MLHSATAVRFAFPQFESARDRLVLSWKRWGTDMSQLARAWRNLLDYFNSVNERRKRRKKEKEDNPYIYPLF